MTIILLMPSGLTAHCQPVRPAVDFDEAVAGLTRQEKITAMIDAMGGDPETETPRAMLISDPAVLCWLLNIRGRDLDHTPFVLAFAVLSAEGMVTVYGEDERFADISQRSLCSLRQCWWMIWSFSKARWWLIRPVALSRCTR